MNLKAAKRTYDRCGIVYPDGTHGHCTWIETNTEGKAVRAFSNSCDGIMYYPAMRQLEKWNQTELADRADRNQQERWDSVAYFVALEGRIDKEG